MPPKHSAAQVLAAVKKHKSNNKAAQALGLNRRTVDQRIARLVVDRPKRVLVIPDTQVAPNVPIDHMAWVAQAVIEYNPDIVVHLGDHWDMPSLSTWDGPGSMAHEGARYEDDIRAGNEALEILTKPICKFRRIILRGNHEHRIARAINGAPRFAGAIGEHHFNDKRLGWEVIEYFHGGPGQFEFEGVVFAHFFPQPNTGKPIAGTVPNRLNKIGKSFVQGHVQGYIPGLTQYAAQGLTRHGVVAGSCYLHDEEYKGYANAHWRGIVVLNEVRNGTFCEMPLTLDYLCRKYERMPLSKFLQKKYPKLPLMLKNQ